MALFRTNWLVRPNCVRAFTSSALAARSWASKRSLSSGRTPARNAWRSARAASSWPCRAFSRAWNSSCRSWAITSFLAIFWPALMGKLTNRPGTWKASSTLFEASTLPGNVRTWESSPAATTIVLTGRTTSLAVGAVGEQLPPRTRMDKAIDTLRQLLLRLKSLAFTRVFSLLPVYAVSVENEMQICVGEKTFDVFVAGRMLGVNLK